MPTFYTKPLLGGYTPDLRELTPIRDTNFDVGHTTVYAYRYFDDNTHIYFYESLAEDTFDPVPTVGNTLVSNTGTTYWAFPGQVSPSIYKEDSTEYTTVWYGYNYSASDFAMLRKTDSTTSGTLWTWAYGDTISGHQRAHTISVSHTDGICIYMDGKKVVGQSRRVWYAVKVNTTTGAGAKVPVQVIANQEAVSGGNMWIVKTDDVNYYHLIYETLLFGGADPTDRKIHVWGYNVSTEATSELASATITETMMGAANAAPWALRQYALRNGTYYYAFGSNHTLVRLSYTTDATSPTLEFFVNPSTTSRDIIACSIESGDTPDSTSLCVYAASTTLLYSMSMDLEGTWTTALPDQTDWNSSTVPNGIIDTVDFALAGKHDGDTADRPTYVFTDDKCFSANWYTNQNISRAGGRLALLHSAKPLVHPKNPQGWGFKHTGFSLGAYSTEGELHHFKDDVTKPMAVGQSSYNLKVYFHQYFTGACSTSTDIQGFMGTFNPAIGNTLIYNDTGTIDGRSFDVGCREFMAAGLTEDGVQLVAWYHRAEDELYLHCRGTATDNFYLGVTTSAYAKMLLFGPDLDNIYAVMNDITPDNLIIRKMSITGHLQSSDIVMATGSNIGFATSMGYAKVDATTYHIWYYGSLDSGDPALLHIYKFNTALFTVSPLATYAVAGSMSIDSGYETYIYTTVGPTKMMLIPSNDSSGTKSMVRVSYTTDPDVLTFEEHVFDGNFNRTTAPTGTSTPSSYGRPIGIYTKGGTPYAVMIGNSNHSNKRQNFFMNWRPMSKDWAVGGWSGWFYCGNVPITSVWPVDPDYTLLRTLSQDPWGTDGRLSPTILSERGFSPYQTIFTSSNLIMNYNFTVWDVRINYVDSSALGQLALLGYADTAMDMAGKILGTIALGGRADTAMILSAKALGGVAINGQAQYIRNVLRAFAQAWTIGDKKKLTHEEYIVGTDFHNDQLAKVNALRAAEGVGGGTIPLNNILDHGATYSLARDWNKYVTRQQIVHDLLAHYDPSFDEDWQTREGQLEAVYTYAAQQPFFFADNVAAAGAPGGIDPNDQTALWYSNFYYDIWYNSAPHKAWMLFDWVDYGSDASKVFLGGMGLDWTDAYTIVGGGPASVSTQVHYDFTTHFLDNEMQRTWNSEYSVVNAELIKFTGEYTTLAWADARAQFSFDYGLRIATQTSFYYGTRAALQIAFPLHYTVSTQIALPYTSLEPVASQVSLPYSLERTVAQFAFNYGLRLSTDATFPYGDTLQSISQIGFPYSLMPHVASQVSLPYTSTTPIASQHGFVYDLSVLNRVLADIGMLYSLVDEQVVISSDQTTVIVDGLVIPVNSANISIAEGDFVWKSTIKLAGLSDYNMFEQDYPFQVTIGAETYEMVVEEKALARGENTNAKVGISLIGLSPAIKFKTPRADLIDFELTVATSAKDVIETILGEPIQWNIVDWIIPPYRLSATEVSPIKLVTQILEVVGALPEALLDGTLQARYKWEIGTDQYASPTPDQIYTDTADNLSASEQTQPFDLFNKFRIREGAGVYSDVIEFFNNDEEDGDDPLSGILRAYPDPWRLTVQITQTNNPALPLNYVGVVQRQETQLVEFVEGIGNVSYPIVSVDTIDWKTYNLGNLVNEDHGKELTAPTDVHYGYGLAEITYTTEAIEYTTSAPFSTDAQFLLEDTG